MENNQTNIKSEIIEIMSYKYSEMNESIRKAIENQTVELQSIKEDNEVKLTQITKDIEDIKSQLSEFQRTLGNLTTWVMDLKEKDKVVTGSNTFNDTHTEIMDVSSNTKKTVSKTRAPTLKSIAGALRDYCLPSFQSETGNLRDRSNFKKMLTEDLKISPSYVDGLENKCKATKDDDWLLKYMEKLVAAIKVNDQCKMELIEMLKSKSLL